MAYPSTIDTFTPKVDDVDFVMAADVNELQTAITAIETELGVDPAGTETDLKTRLSHLMDAVGNLAFKDSTALTISAGAVTATQNFHRVDTESSAASDDLDTISGITDDDGFFLVIRPVSADRNVIIKHGTGNIQTRSGGDITLDLVSDVVCMIYDANLSKWLAFAGSSVTTADVPTLAGDNSWTGTNVFAEAIALKYNALTADTTLDNTHQIVNVNTAGGAVTLTLPPAAGVTGRMYYIRKTDVSANKVTVDGNGSETINGALTYALSAQYQTVTLASDGAGWIVL